MKRQLALISLLTAASQLSAFFKLWFTARIFGVGSELDGYNLALVLPTLISSIAIGFLQTGFFPVRARLHSKGSKQQTEAFERSVLWASFCIGIVFSLMLAITTPWIAPLIGQQAPTSVTAALTFSLPFTAPLIALNMLGDCAGYLLAMRSRFSIAAAAPIVNGLLGGALLALWPEGGLLNLVLGTLIGLIAQVAICLLGLAHLRFSFFGLIPAWTELKRLFFDIAKLGGWIMPGVVFTSLIVSLPPLWITSFGEGAVSAFGYAYRLHSSAIQLLIMASSTVILANFSDLIAKNDIASIRQILRHARMISLIIGVASTILVGIAAVPVLEAIFWGRFDSQAASRVATHWIWLTVGLGFAILGNVYAKLWQSQGRPHLMSIFAGCAVVVLCISYWLLRIHLSEYALAAALSISSMTVALLGPRYLNVKESVEAFRN